MITRYGGMVMNLVDRRMDFPTLRGEDVPAYLDNACVTLKPDSVLQAINEYYSSYPGCGGRSIHRYGSRVSMAVNRSRRKVAELFNANSADEITFTRNATHSLNQVAKGIGLEKGDVVLTTDREHNSNLVPWLQLEQNLGIAKMVSDLFKQIKNVDENQLICEFLLTHPEYRGIVKRIQSLKNYPYSEVQDNVLDKKTIPIDMLRFKLSFFGANRYDPKSDRWLRVSFFSGAPYLSDLNNKNVDEWGFATMNSY